MIDSLRDFLFSDGRMSTFRRIKRGIKCFIKGKADPWLHETKYAFLPNKKDNRPCLFDLKMKGKKSFFNFTISSGNKLRFPKRWAWVLP